MNKSRGRPRGNPATRDHLVEVGRRMFLGQGYRGATLRAIATEADVDAALISYHFGSKQGLFSECMKLRGHPAQSLSAVLRGGPDRLAERILDAVTTLWDDPEIGGPLAELLRMSLHDEQVARAYREYLDRELAEQLAEFLGGPDASARATASVAVIGGLILTRYLTPLSPMARLTAAQVRQVMVEPLRAALYARRGPGRAPPPRLS